MTEPIEVDEGVEAVPPEEALEAPEAPAEPSEEEQAEEEQAETPEAPEEPEEPSQPVGAVGEKELDKMFKKVETANAAYARKIGDILGDEATVLDVCPRCSDPFVGLIWPPAMRPVSAEVKAAVLVSVGEEPAQAVRKDRYAQTCGSCDGMGATLSGSKTNRERTLTCYDCQGRGWTPVGPERAGGATVTPMVAQTNGVTEQVEQPPDVDPWGTPPTDPDYGRMPQYRGVR